MAPWALYRLHRVSNRPVCYQKWVNYNYIYTIIILFAREAVCPLLEICLINVNVVAHIDEVSVLYRAGLVLWWVTVQGYTALKELAMATATARKKNGEFCVTVGPVTTTVGILTYT